VPALNRRQQIDISLLVSYDQAPHVQIACTVKGVALKYAPRRDTIFGVERRVAGWTGLVVALAFTTLVATLPTPRWMAVGVALFIGLIAALPGAGAVRAWRWVRSVLDA
jgi:hypothetical protein